MADETKAPEQSAPSERPRRSGAIVRAEIVRGLAAVVADAGRAVLRAKAGRKFFRRKKVCKFCVEKMEDINYKDYRMLGQFVAESGKIVPRRLTGVCSPHQHRLSAAIKKARNIALLPFAGRAS